MDEKALILEKLGNSDLTIQQIANQLGYSVQTLYRRLNEYKIEHGRKHGRRIGYRKLPKTQINSPKQ